MSKKENEMNLLSHIILTLKELKDSYDYVLCNKSLGNDFVKIHNRRDAVKYALSLVEDKYEKKYIKN